MAKRVWSAVKKLAFGRRAVAVQRHVISEWSITVLLLLFGTTTLVQAYVIPTGSMDGTLLIGDHVLVDKLAYAPPGALSRHLLPYTEPQRGDIIVFRYPPDISQTLVKRCMGVPGDRVRMVDQQLFVNGKKLNEPYVQHIGLYRDPYQDNFPNAQPLAIPEGGRTRLLDHVQAGEVVVPPGHYLALGDNRDNSSDSRYWGFVPRENIIGKPLLVYWSYDAPTEHLNDTGINIDHMVDLAQNFFVKTRWSRTFSRVRSQRTE